MTILTRTKEFKPVLWYHEGIQTYIYLNKDCSYVSHRVDSNLDILYDGHNPEKIVGVQIHSKRL